LLSGCNTILQIGLPAARVKSDCENHYYHAQLDCTFWGDMTPHKCSFDTDYQCIREEDIWIEELQRNGSRDLEVDNTNRVRMPLSE